METELVKEGEVELEVPKLEDYKTSPNEYVPSQTPVFFNPLMELSRDVSVSSLKVFGEEIEGLRVCDLLAGVGARGLRYAKEINGLSKVIINDRLSEAVDFIQKNVERNESEIIEVKEEDGNIFLRNHRPRFHAIDIDPFGTPIPFLDSAFSAISRRGIFLITATDTAPLCAAYPNACIRKYGAKPLRVPYSQEIGLRILIGAIQKRAATYDLALTPILSHSTQHYFRTHCKVTQGAKKANKILKNHGYLSHCSDCGKRKFTKTQPANLPQTCKCGKDFEHAGPMWLEDFAEKEHLQEVIENLSLKNYELENKERKLLRACLKELDGPPGFYDLHEVSSRAGVSPPKFRKVLSELKDQEYFASRTHFSDTGIRTDAPIEVLNEIIKN